MKENGKLELLVTIHSDELMPWPEGLAPWSMEQGGIGIPPTSVQKKMKKERQPDIIAPSKKVVINVLAPPEINSNRALSAHYEAVSLLLNDALKFQKEHVKNPEDVATMNIIHAQAQANLAQLSGIKTNRL